MKGKINFSDKVRYYFPGLMYDEVLALFHPAMEFAWKPGFTSLPHLHLFLQHHHHLEAILTSLFHQTRESPHLSLRDIFCLLLITVPLTLHFPQHTPSGELILYLYNSQPALVPHTLNMEVGSQ